jgi:phosphoglycolate phosphatase
VLAQIVVDRSGLRSHFGAVVGALPGRPEKPSPIPLLETITSLGASPGETITVGDSALDLRCPRNARVSFIGVAFGYCRPPMSQLGADVTIASYRDFEAACGLLGDRRP